MVLRMSTPPPPMPSGPGGFNPPPGYQPYGGPAMQQQPTNSGLAIAGFVLSLVGLVPCFWLFQIPALLGTIFGFIGLKQTKDGARKGRGMALTAVILGVLLVLACVAFWVYFSTNSNCVRTGSTWNCTTN